VLDGTSTLRHGSEGTGIAALDEWVIEEEVGVGWVHEPSRLFVAEGFNTHCWSLLQHLDLPG
jgi:hypothetical protein